jgi:large repetitive protein
MNKNRKGIGIHESHTAEPINEIVSEDNKMKNDTRESKWMLRIIAMLSVMLTGMQVSFALPAVTVNVVDGNRSAMTNGFRWILEQDTTTVTVPGAQTNNSVSLSINRSYCPVISTGHEATASAVIPLPSINRYVVSVLPDSGYTMSSATITNGQTTVTVTVNATPVPTAQITIEVYNDNNPINNAKDLTEQGLAGFRVVFQDNLGQVSQDAFGKPVGTTYQQDTNGDFILDGNGMPTVDVMGTGSVLTDTNGVADIKYMMPARYQVEVIPPAGETWYQTSTIDGTHFIDAWVKLNEPANMIEFGMISKHVSYGFVNPSLLPWAQNRPTSGGTITGRLVDDHFAKPPAINSSFPGAPVPEGIIGLNDLSSGAGLYTALCNADSTFTITNVPPGTYELVTWDKPQDLIIGFNTVIVTSNGETVAMGDVLCGRWHGWLEGTVFYDSNTNGFRDPGEPGIPDQLINIRNRDGSIVQSTFTDDSGFYSFREVVLNFKWYVVETDTTRYKPTGMTAAIDDGGGPIPTPNPTNDWVIPSFGKLNPQPQATINPNTGNNLSRTEKGLVFTEAMMNFQCCVIDWGKVSYPSNENGGISGGVWYDTTRAEDDPREAVAEGWEPGIPRVQVNLYSDANHDKIIDDLNGDGHVTLADVDNYPFGWITNSSLKGVEDIDRNSNSVFDAGDAIQITRTTCWDDNMPTGSIQTNTVYAHGLPVTPGYDSFGTWDQVRPGAFDGEYFFSSYFPSGMATNMTNSVSLPKGDYIVEAVTPPGYEVFKSQDRNIFNGDPYTPSPLMLKPECVGDAYVVPQYLALFPNTQIGANLAGTTNHLADKKLVTLNEKRNGAADFFFFTEVPKAARAVGLVTDDLHANFDPNHPFYGEKATPSWIPISFQDYAGHELVRVYCDEYGVYNAMLPSTYSVNVPMPSGVSPGVYMIVLNDPTMPDPANPGQVIPDPYYDPDYGTDSSSFDFWPGMTAYPDTPILPQGAFVGYPNGRMDIEPTNGTPVIFSAVSPACGPYLPTPASVLTITALGTVQVPNPLYLATNGLPLMVTRDFGFGSTQGSVTVNGMPLNITSWATNMITATAPTNVPTGELMITRGDNGLTTRIGLTVTIGATVGTVHSVTNSPYPAHAIQDAIDAANPGDLILVGPGAYDENPIIWKPVRLQGSGAESTFIKGTMNPPERLTAWHATVQQILGTPGTDPFTTSDGPGILVMGDVGYPFGAGNNARIDGFNVAGTAVGGAIMVYTKAHYLQISNNRIKGNNGTYAGAIAVGTPGTGVSSANDHIRIVFNEILKNGSAGRAGVAGAGGIGLFMGSDNYEVSDNIIQGNLSTANGAGIAHIGLSQNGLIARNKILFNEVIDDLPGLGYGGGIYVAGDAAATGLTPGAGTVTIDGNLIQGNLSGAADGGGIYADSFNGQDVSNSPGNTNNWYALYLFNNIIVNNVAGYAGGGISLQDVARGIFIHNTVADNDSCATAPSAFPAAGGNSIPQGAGLVAHSHSALLATASGQTFSSPVLYDNIIWHNQSFYVDVTLNGGAGGIVLNPTTPYWDLQEFDGIGQLDPRKCILSDTTGYHSSNISSDPLFVAPYTNSNMIATVPDEASGTVSLRFTPIYPGGNYHITAGSPAKDKAESSFLSTYADLQSDYDADYRPYNTNADIGADEYVVASTVAATNDSYAIIENGFLIVAASGVLANDGGPGTLTAVLSSDPLHGSLTLFSNGSFAYRPATNFFGTDTFSYRAKSGSAYSLPALVSIAVMATNQQPVAVNDSYTVNGNGSIIVAAPGVLANDSDPNAAPLTAAWLVGPNKGVLSLNAKGSFTYTPTNGFTGADTFFYTANNGALSSAPASVTLNVTAPQPDFVVTGISVTPAVVSNGGPFSVSVTVTNQGTSGGNAGRLSIWLDMPGAAMATGTVGNAYTNLGTLNAGASTTVTFSALSAPIVPIPGVPQYNATLRAFVNSTGAQTEFSQTNNQLTQLYAVTPVFVDDCPPDTDGIDTDGDGNVSNDNVCVHLAAGDGFVKMADGRDMYIFGFSDGTGRSTTDILQNNMLRAGSPAPTMVFREGQHVYLHLTNVGMMMRPDLFDPHSVHFHGFPNAAPIFDGEPMASIAVNMGSTFTYYYEPVEPGTYMYHCHVEASEHMQQGMLGMLWVEPKQNMLPNGTNLNGFTHIAGYKYAYNDGDGSTHFDVETPLQITAMDSKFHDYELNIQPTHLAAMKDDYYLLNGRGYPDTVNTNVILNKNVVPSQRVHAKTTITAGKKILLRISSLSTVDFTTLSSSLPMKIVGRGARLLRGPAPAGGGVGKNLYYTTTSVTLGGGESYDAIIDTAGVAPGTYFIYSSNLNQLSNGTEENGGLMTEITVQ